MELHEVIDSLDEAIDKLEHAKNGYVDGNDYEAAATVRDKTIVLYSAKKQLLLSEAKDDRIARLIELLRRAKPSVVSEANAHGEDGCKELADEYLELVAAIDAEIGGDCE